jgi:hypothetical protein
VLQAVMDNFEYDAPAEVYSSNGRGTQKRPVTYRRFDTSADAIRFTIEQLPETMQRGTVMEVGDERFEFTQIFELYNSERYPLSRTARQSAGPASS